MRGPRGRGTIIINASGCADAIVSRLKAYHTTLPAQPLAPRRRTKRLVVKRNHHVGPQEEARDRGQGGAGHGGLHHAVADTYQKIVNAAKEKNENCRVLGVTATPNRSDDRGLIEVFTNVGDQILVGELIRSGHLVPPRTFIMDVGVRNKLLDLKKIFLYYL